MACVRIALLAFALAGVVIAQTEPTVETSEGSIVMTASDVAFNIGAEDSSRNITIGSFYTDFLNTLTDIQGVKSAATATNTRIDSLISSLANVRQAVDANTARLVQQDSQLARKLNTDVYDAYRQETATTLSAITSTVMTKADAALYNADRSAYSTQHATFSSGISTASSSISVLGGRMSAVESSVVQVSSTVAVSQSDINRLNTSTVSMRTSVDATFSSVLAELSAVRTELSVLKTLGPTALLTNGTCSPLYGYRHEQDGYDYYTPANVIWNDYTAYDLAVIETVDPNEQVKVTFDFSVLGIVYGGIRLVDYTFGDVYGTNAQYGFDWVIPSISSVWFKSNFFRVITIPRPGKHAFRVQIRGQAATNRFYINSGNREQNYAGFHILLERLIPSTFAFFFNPASHDITTGSWVNLNGMSDVCYDVIDNTEDLKVSLDFGVLGIQHGGMRLLQDGVVVHTNPVYGMDWVIDNNPSNNAWQKRSYFRVLTNVPRGRRCYRIQIRSQADGSRFLVNGGTPSENYSGFLFLIEKLRNASPKTTSEACKTALRATTPRSYCYMHFQCGHDHYSEVWTDLGVTPECRRTCDITTTRGHYLLVNIDFSVYGNTHGGMRLIMDDTTIVGQNPTYGLDWIIPNYANQWQKRRITRRIGPIPPGPHSFKVQIKSQTADNRIYIHPGEPNGYSGLHLLVEELP